MDNLLWKLLGLVGNRPCVLVVYRSFHPYDPIKGIARCPQRSGADYHQPVVVAIGGGSVIDGAKVLRHVGPRPTA